MLIIGIDDAGRGPLIGPMVLAGVLVDKNSETIFKKANIKDSKQYFLNSHRIKKADIIKGSSLAYEIITTSPEQIDKSLAKKINLNTLEAIKTAEIINSLNPEKKKVKVLVDCPSVNTMAWRKTLLGYIKHSDNLEIHCEHKADVNYISVAAASLLAKVKREEEVEKLKKQYGDMGSGYPADPVTKKFLREHGKKLAKSGIFRKSWATWKKLFPEPKQGQASLKEF